VAARFQVRSAIGYPCVSVYRDGLLGAPAVDESYRLQAAAIRPLGPVWARTIPRPALVPRRGASDGEARVAAVKVIRPTLALVRGLVVRVQCVGLAGIEPATSPLSGLAAVAASNLVKR